MEGMGKNKYYDWSRRLTLDAKKDGCAYEHWANGFRVFPFAIHEKGFLVFLAPAELEALDEYRRGDPYTMEGNVKSEFQQRRIECTLELIESAIAAGERDIRILDLGCGQGHITSKILEHFPGAEVSGLDCSLSAISYGVDHFKGIDFVVGNAYSPPYVEDYFDVVVCNNLWEHVPDPLCLLRAIRTVIRTGGSLIISTPSRYRLRNLIRVMCGKPITFVSKSHVTEYSVGQIIEQLAFGEFEVVKVYSKSLKLVSVPIAARIGYRLIMPPARLFLRKIGSHHVLENTTFLLARKS
jgi:2-polyprenyl-3-methyl-5-hydroxy-6-metoxy-1,4-benzoquinol methylase